MTDIFEIKDHGDWVLMRDLVQSIKFYKENNGTGKYKRALQKETDMLGYLKKIAKAA